MESIRELVLFLVGKHKKKKSVRVREWEKYRSLNDVTIVALLKIDLAVVVCDIYKKCFSTHSKRENKIDYEIKIYMFTSYHTRGCLKLIIKI